MLDTKRKALMSLSGVNDYKWPWLKLLSQARLNNAGFPIKPADYLFIISARFKLVFYFVQRSDNKIVF